MNRLVLSLLVNFANLTHAATGATDCYQYFRKSAVAEAPRAAAAGVGAAALFTGGVVGLFKKGYRLPGIASLVVSSYTGNVSSVFYKNIKFKELMARLAHETQLGQVGPYTRLLTEFLNGIIYDKETTSRLPASLFATLSDHSRSELAAALDNQRVTPERMQQATLDLINNGLFCTPNQEVRDMDEWTSLMVVTIGKFNAAT